MAASTVLTAYEADLKQLNANLRLLASGVGAIQAPIVIVNDFVKPRGTTSLILGGTDSLGTLAAASKMADQLGKIAYGFQIPVLLMKQIGATKVLATVAKEIIDGVESTMFQIESRIDTFHATWKPELKLLGQVNKLMSAEIGSLQVAAGRVALYVPSIHDANVGLNTAQNTVKVVGGSQGAALDAAINGVIATIAASSLANTTLMNQFNSVFSSVRSTIDQMKAVFDLQLPQSLINAVHEFTDSLKRIFDKLDFLSEPMEAVNDAAKALKPVLDAVAFILYPLEQALNWVLEKTGLKGLIDEARDYILDLLPHPEFLDQLDKAIAAAIAPIHDIEQKVTGAIDALLPKLLELFVPQTPTNGKDIYFGTPFNDVYFGLGGDDFISGGPGNDTIDGGSGLDVIIGGSGNDTLDGGAGPGRDIAIYSGNKADYVLSKIFIGNDQLPNGIWQIRDIRSNGPANGGTDQLKNIEDAVFADGIVKLDVPGIIIQTHSAAGSPKTVSTTAADPALRSTAAGDAIFGDVGFDLMRGGEGSDSFVGVANSQATKDSSHHPGDWAFGEAGYDTFTVGSVDDNFDGGDQFDTVSYVNLRAGVRASLADDLDHPDRNGDIGNDNSYFSLAHADQSYWGRENPYNSFDDADKLGKLVHVEHMLGSDFADVLYGSSYVNHINGGKGDDTIRGLDGEDLLIGGDGNDVLIGDRDVDVLLGDGGDDFFVGGQSYSMRLKGFFGDQYFGGEGVDTLWYGASDSLDLYFGGTTTGFADLDAINFATSGYVGAAGGGSGSTPNKPFEGLGLDLPYYVVAYLAEGKVDKWGRYTHEGTDTIDSIERFYASSGNDTVWGSTRDETIFGGGGKDDLRGGGGNDVLNGGDGDDEIRGGSGNDQISGGAGDDYLTVAGGVAGSTSKWDSFSGQDVYDGGPGDADVLSFGLTGYSWRIDLNQHFAWGVAPLSTSDPIDSPYSFSNSTPEQLDPSVFGGYHQIYGIESFYLGNFRNVVRTDDAGHKTVISGDGDDYLFSQGNGDTFRAGGGDDTLVTSAGADFNAALINTYYGDRGNDLFIASDALERMYGGTGIDTLSYQHVSAAVAVNLALGLGGHGDSLGNPADYTSPDDGMENVSGSQFNDALTGDERANGLVGLEGADTLIGGGGSDALYGGDGDDQLFGGEGDDLLHGGDGTDRLDGGPGIDTASWSQSEVDAQQHLTLSARVVNVVADLASHLANGAEQLVSIENLIGGAGDDQLSGDDGPNQIFGGAGQDMLSGRGGNDTLVGDDGDDQLLGGDGDDVLIGGLGTNTIDGGADRDTLNYSGAARGITVVMPGVGSRAASDTGTVSVHNDVTFAVWADSLRQVQDPLGPVGAMISTGTTEVRRLVAADPATDVTPDRILRLNPLYGQTAADLLPVAIYAYDFVPAQADPEIAIITHVVDSLDIFKNIEVIYGGAGSDSMLGNASDNEFHGKAGNDTLSGGGGKDTIEGGAGNDILNGDDGMDTAVFSGARAQYTIVMATGGDGMERTTVTDLVANRDGVDILTSVERLKFSDLTLAVDDATDTTPPTVPTVPTPGDDLLTGTNGADTIDALAGNDIVNALGGDDRITGGPGADFINGGLGNDTAVYTGVAGGLFADYLLSRNSQGVVTVSDRYGVMDTLTDVEYLEIGGSVIPTSTLSYLPAVTVAPDGVSDLVFRFYNVRDKAYFYTPSVAARDEIIRESTDPDYKPDTGLWPYFYQGATFEQAHSSAGAMPVYRFWNYLTGHHFFTLSEAEKDYVLKESTDPNFTPENGLWPFNYEGVGFAAYGDPNHPGAEPVFRFYSYELNRHFFTADVAEANEIKLTGLWVDEGNGFYGEVPG